MKLPWLALAALLLVLALHQQRCLFSGSRGEGEAARAGQVVKSSDGTSAHTLPHAQPVASRTAGDNALTSLRERLMQRVTRTRADRPEERFILPSVRQALGTQPDPEAEFIAARELWREDKVAEAIPELHLLIESYPAHEVSLYAANMLFDGLITQSPDAAELFYWSDLYSGNAALLEDRSELSERLAGIRAISLRKMAEEWEAAGDYPGCYLSYQSILETLMDAPGRDEILYNAALCAEKAGLEAEARRAWAELARAHPDSPLAMTALTRLQV